MKITFVVDTLYDLYKREWPERVSNFLFKTPGCISADYDTFGWRYHNKEVISDFANLGYVNIVESNQYTNVPYSFYLINIGRIEHLTNPSFFDNMAGHTKEFLHYTNLPIMLFYALEGTGFLSLDVYKNLIKKRNDHGLNNKIYIFSLVHYNDAYFNKVQFSDMDPELKDLHWIHSICFFPRYAGRTTHTVSMIENMIETGSIVEQHDYANKKYNFLCLNSTPSQNRIMLLKMLYDEPKIWNNNLISHRFQFPESEDEVNNARRCEIMSILQQEKSYVADNDTKEILADCLPILENTVATSDFMKFIKKLLYTKVPPVTIIKGDGPPVNDIYDINWYKDTVFSLVTETFQWQSENQCNHTMLTEKVTKSIVHKHPFIIYGYGNSHKLLQLYGFKTFEDLFNIPKDGINGNLTSAERLYHIINSLKNFDVRKIDTKELEARTLYNYNHLINTDWYQAQCDIIKKEIMIQSNL